MSRPSNDRARSELKSILAERGVRGAVEFLNSLTPHRFTSLFRFDGETLRNLTFFDRENPGQETCDEIPVTASYCVFVRDSGATFSVHDAPGDARVKDHAKRDTVQCYCGVPLLDRNGRMFGSICHFDLKPGRISALDVELMEAMAGMLQNHFESVA
jgi:GAF domain-containing protein